MYSYLVTLYVKLYELQHYHLKINTSNELLNKIIIWNEFILEVFKSNYIDDVNYERQQLNNIINTKDILSVVESIQALSVGIRYEEEINLLVSYILNIDIYTVKSGYCDKCDIGLWREDSFENSVCLYHENNICRLFPNEYYSI